MIARTALLLLAMAASPAIAQWLPSYGGERAGQASYSFLKSDYHIGSSGMGSVGSVCWAATPEAWATTPQDWRKLRD